MDCFNSQHSCKEVNENLEKFELGIAVQKIYEFIWDCYCDWYIELVKTRLSSDGEDAQNARQVLLYVLDQILRLLHPLCRTSQKKSGRQFLTRAKQ